MPFFFALLFAAFPSYALSPEEAVGGDLYEQAIEARSQAGTNVKNDRYLVIIDYRQHSAEPRFHFIDTELDSVESFLVAHGQGSDRNHDGIADKFSNKPNSHMTSLGGYVTGKSYYGRHGLSLRLRGLDKSNDKAEQRAIVIHGADYVTPNRRKLGRSWGCPALERRVAKRLIPLIKNGVFVYAHGEEY